MIRGTDKHGSGHFGAPRGKRTHRGVDVVCEKYTVVKSISEGTVSKLGWAYDDDLSFRYVEITDSSKARWRYFYISPLVAVGDKIGACDIIGQCQDIAARYEGITPHYHLEIYGADGELIDPTGFVEDM